ncbi:MAG: 4Fe-4S dicluster domain-containing protein [Cyclobacteriaceae bacterium]
MPTKESGYWSGLSEIIGSVISGLKLTAAHILKAGRTSMNPARLTISDAEYFNNQGGLSTIQFPHEQLPIPENGRYKLHNEIDDCIVCDKCVKVCPVNCITIDPVRAPEEFGKTSDGTSKRIYAARFDIDMSKCCFCGLCTTVCPTECLTMTPEYAFSSFDIRDHNFKFSEMTEQEIEAKKTEWEKYLETKNKVDSGSEKASAAIPPKPVFKPMIKPSIPKPQNQGNNG